MSAQQDVAIKTVTLPFNKSDSQFSVLSYNLLADVYVRVPGQCWNAYAHVPDEVLEWSARRQKIAETLGGCQADVICLQEVIYEKRERRAGEGALWQLPAFLDFLEEEHGYVAVAQGLKQKDWDGNSKRNMRMVGRPVPTGLACFYKKAVFSESHPSQHGSGSGIVVFLRPTALPKLVLAVANTHLVGDPAKFDMHVKQLGGIQSKLGAGSPSHRLICGDFNQELSPSEIPEGAAESPVQAWIANHGFLDAPTPHSWASPGKALRLDHCLLSPGISILGLLPGLSARDIESGLPNLAHPSDHIPIGISFRLKQ